MWALWVCTEPVNYMGLAVVWNQEKSGLFSVTTTTLWVHLEYQEKSSQLYDIWSFWQSDLDVLLYNKKYTVWQGGLGWKQRLTGCILSQTITLTPPCLTPESASHKCSSLWFEQLIQDSSVHSYHGFFCSLRYGFFFATLSRKPASQSHLFTVHVETGLFLGLFNEAASWGPVRRGFVILDSRTHSCTGDSHSSFYSDAVGASLWRE